MKTTELLPARKPVNGRERDEHGDTVPPVLISVGDFVTYSLVTDTVVLEVIDISPSGKTLTLRECSHGEAVHSEDNGSPYPVVYTAAVPNPYGRTITTRRGKAGYFTVRGLPRNYRPARLIDGVPVERVDYSF